MASVNPQQFKTRSLRPLANSIFKSRKQNLLPWLQLITTSQVAPDIRAVSVFQGIIRMAIKELWVSVSVLRARGTPGGQPQPPPQKGPSFWLVPAVFLHCHFTSFSLIFSLCVLAHNSTVEGLFPRLKDIILKHDNKTSKFSRYKFSIS